MAIAVDNSKIGSTLHEINANTDNNRFFPLLVSLIDVFRKRKTAGAASTMRYLCDRLQNEQTLRRSFSRMIVYLLQNRNSVSLLTQSGIDTEAGFSAQLFSQIKHRILPPLEDKRSLKFFLDTAFHYKKDYMWVQAIPDNLWIEFIGHIQFTGSEFNAYKKNYLNEALSYLSYQIANPGVEQSLSRKASRSAQSHFIIQNNLINSVIALVNGNQEQYLIDAAVEETLEVLNSCKDFILKTRKNSVKNGTSLNQSYIISRTLQQIYRLSFLLRLYKTGKDSHSNAAAITNFIKSTIENENKKRKISHLYRRNIGMLAYEIAEHKGNTGEHYITTNRKGYRGFLLAAMGGGAIITLIALFKTLLHFIHWAPFWEYFLYGLNYAIGFILLQLTHTTLATKQPAMTASTLASYLDERKHKNSLQKVAQSFVFVWRSQTAAFIGNLIVVFPMSYAIAFIWPYIFGHELVSTEQAQNYLNAQNPLHTHGFVWVYACITGVFLFLSGIVSGYIDNKIRFSNMAPRIREHPLLKPVMNGAKRDRFAQYLDRNLGGFIGNAFLGFSLGFAPFIGILFGIPFDIRHITISTAQFGFGLADIGYVIDNAQLIAVTIGVLGVGFCNFAVSFGLAFTVALRSRSVNFIAYSGIVPMIFRYFFRYPFDFIFPPRRERKLEDIYGNKS